MVCTGDGFMSFLFYFAVCESLAYMTFIVITLDFIDPTMEKFICDSSSHIVQKNVGKYINESMQ